MRLETITNGEDLFDELQREDERETRKFERLDNKQKELFDIYNQWCKESWINEFWMNYNLAVKLIQPKFFFIFPKNKGYNAQSIEEFSINLHDYRNIREDSGLFISALINTSRDKHFRIFNYSDICLDFLGHKNTKQILINGNVGRWLGSKMRGGQIVLNGNAKRYTAGYMIGGEIIINGHTDPIGLCYYMKGGSLYLNGRDKPNLSQCRIYFIRHGKIYHNGELIFKNGRYLG